jgi:hypothetical protein
MKSSFLKCLSISLPNVERLYANRVHHYPSNSPFSNALNSKCDKLDISGCILSIYNDILIPLWTGLTRLKSHKKPSNLQIWATLEPKLLHTGNSGALAKNLGRNKRPHICHLSEVGLA